MSETEPRQERRRAWVWWIGGIAALLVFCAALQPLLLPRPCPVNRAAYDRIEKGTHREDVERILGGPEGDYTTRPLVFTGTSFDYWECPGWDGVDPLMIDDLTHYATGRPHWTGNDGCVAVAFDASGAVIGKWYFPHDLQPITFLGLIRWRLERVKDRWFPPTPPPIPLSAPSHAPSSP